ncbi:MbnP family protein [Flavobacterium sp. I3-2]|uniref:MbnP family protein n=1 Tax=Flavobacterium sp. I3-2 TaxID=2748319 RepID=UPI0015B1FD68|nr:MbnP family protein [Flavobacterium sp. I3-2]
MKNIFKILSILMVSLLVTCNSNDDSIATNEKGNVQLFFDHTFNGDKLLLETSFYTNSNNESLQISRFSYIISNIRLINDKGETFTYPKNESYFIIDSGANQLTIDLENVPAANYTSITFGIGVDQEKYLTGENDQQEFWDLAAQHEMTWAWITGYKFINMEGVFRSNEVEGTPNFSVHVGSHGTALDNYKEITLSLPNSARVRENMRPSIHFLVDANKILDGTNKIKLSENLNPAGTTASIMVNANLSPKIHQNATEMFTVDHVHNSGESH